MLNYIRETRSVKEGLHNIILEIPEQTYMTFYNAVNDKIAQEILTQYLNYHQDDARFSDVKIQYNKSVHMINIYANLHYLGNEKTCQKPYTDNYVK